MTLPPILVGMAQKYHQVAREQEQTTILEREKKKFIVRHQSPQNDV